MKLICLSFLAWFMFNSAVNAQQISEWREENRTGVSSETGLLKYWPVMAYDIKT